VLRFILGMLFGFLVVMVSNGEPYIFTYSEADTSNSIAERELSLFRALSADEQANADDSTFANKSSFFFDSKLGVERTSKRLNVNEMISDSASAYEKSCKVRPVYGLSSPTTISEHRLELFSEDTLALSASTRVAPSYDYLMEASVYCL
jgi:hypothetical protein